MKLWMVVAAVMCTAGAAWAVNTGGMDYWDGAVPVEYIYSTYTVSGPNVDTGTMEYPEGDGFARYIYKTEEASTFNQWLSAYPGTEGSTGADDTDGDGWSNTAEYAYLGATGEESDPINPGSGGQAIRLEEGWNLIGVSADVCYYAGAAPATLERDLIPVTSGNYVPVTDIETMLTDMGIGARVEKIVGWHPSESVAEQKGPVTWTGDPELDSLSYIAGGYGYWVKVSAGGACTWKVAGKSRLKPVDEALPVAMAKGWNMMGDLFSTVHYGGAPPSDGSGPETAKVWFGSDETGNREALTQSGFLTWLTEMVYASTAPAPTGVAAMVAYDVDFPYVRTYYEGIPTFLQTLRYVGPGMGMLMNIDPALTDIEMRYPIE